LLIALIYINFTQSVIIYTC